MHNDISCINYHMHSNLVVPLRRRGWARTLRSLDEEGARGDGHIEIRFVRVTVGALPLAAD